MEIDTAYLEIYKFKTCLDELGDLVGIQYTLSDLTGNEYSLSAIGDVSETSGECRDLQLRGEIEFIAASYSERTETVSAIRYMQKPVDDSNTGKMVTFGPLLDSDTGECNDE